MSDWCVLRMSGLGTLRVFETLRDGGFEVWTPVATRQHRVGAARKRVEKIVPLLPTFVFASRERLGELVALSRSPSQSFQKWDAEQRRMVTVGCPHFSVMRYAGRFIAVPDRSLDTLRTAEQRGKPLAKARVFQPGERVKCPDGGFGGLTGVVETTRGRHALVLFSGFAIPVTIPVTSLLTAA